MCAFPEKRSHIWGLLIGRAVTGLSHSKDLHGDDRRPLQATQILNPIASYGCCNRGARRAPGHGLQGFWPAQLPVRYNSPTGKPFPDVLGLRKFTLHTALLKCP